LIDKIAKDAPSLASRSTSAPAALAQLVARCLERDPAARPPSAESLLADLRSLAAPPAVVMPRSRRTVMLGVVALLLVATAFIARNFASERRARWVHETAIPTIQRLIDNDELDSAFALAEEAERRAPGDSVVDALWPLLSQMQEFLSEPSGAEVTRAALDDTTRWIRVGTTPTPAVRIPRNAWFYRYTLPGYRTVTVMGARIGGSYVPIPSPIPMRRVTDPDSDMVLLRGGRLTATLYGLAVADTFVLSDFLMDRLEVTNRQYKAFVDAGGYANRALWDSVIVRDGRPIDWQTAMSRFTDRTGRPGPSTWEGGAPPDEDADLPVGGVSWYEARAYARFAGKALPTAIEWNAAAIPEAARWVVPSGRYESTGPVRGGRATGVSPRGVYDMAGNVREWTVNEGEPGNRYILGGGWSDPIYLFSQIYTQPEFDRSAINGIRLVKRLGDGEDLARASAPLPRPVRDFTAIRPVDDATFRNFLALYDYDRTPFNAQIVLRDTAHADWVREDAEFDMPGTSERMRTALFLPKRVRPPFQAVVIWPAGDAFIPRDPGQLSLQYADYIIRSGRAVIYPVFEHTYGRGSPMRGDRLTNTIAHRDQMIRWTTEMRRSIDYAFTRADVDSTRLAFAGTSWGGRLGGTVIAIEPRFRTAVLNVAGIEAAVPRPEEDPVNFLPRIRIPVLMLSGRYDSAFPYETSQLPFYRLLGSAPDEKKQIMFDGGHFLLRTAVMSETLKWLDRYLGPVARQ
ncbi:MAG TPA: SUMF1/EgtB/PvdO family nonheme iron enzyme, partial [Gemmatimonadaceae bacterium]